MANVAAGLASAMRCNALRFASIAPYLDCGLANHIWRGLQAGLQPALGLACRAGRDEWLIGLRRAGSSLPTRKVGVGNELPTQRLYEIMQPLWLQNGGNDARIPDPEKYPR